MLLLSKRFLFSFLLLLCIVSINSTSLAAFNDADIALRRAILNNSLEDAQQAINAGANINHVEKDYTDNPLGIAINYEYIDMVALLLKNGANPNVFVDGNGFFNSTPLITAISRQRTDIVKLLVENGADVNLQAHKYFDPETIGISPLMQAIIAPYTKESLNIFHYLMEKQANVNLTTDDGQTALMYAANGDFSVYRQHAMILMAEEMLKKGADVKMRTTAGKTALDYAIDNKFSRMIELLTPKVSKK